MTLELQQSDCEGGKTMPLMCTWRIFWLSPRWHLAYRAIMAIYVPGVSIWLGIYLDSSWKFFSFLSNWSTVVAGIYAISQFVFHLASLKEIEEINSFFLNESNNDVNVFINKKKRYYACLANEYRNNKYITPNYKDRIV